MRASVKRPKGIALIMVLTILGVLVTLSGAFVGINHSNFALMASAMDQEEATAACYTGYYYALYSVEHDRRWGKNVPGFATGTRPSAAELAEVADLLDVEVVNAFTLRCYPKNPDGSRTGTSLLLEVRNNLANDWLDAPGPGRDPIPAGGPFPAVPWNCLFLRVTGDSGGVQKRLESLLTAAPPFDAAATANGDVLIEADQEVVIDSRDKYINQLRSKSRLNLTPNQAATDKVQFRWSADATLDALPIKGRLWAQDQIFVGGHDMSDPNPLTNKKAEVEANAEGLVVPKASKSFTIQDLNINDFRMEDTTPKASIKPGTWSFGQTNYTVTYEVSNEVTETVAVPVYDETTVPPTLIGTQDVTQTRTLTTSVTDTVSYPALERKVGGTVVETWVHTGSVPGAGSTFTPQVGTPGTITSITPQASVQYDDDGVIDLSQIGTAALPAGIGADHVQLDIMEAQFNVGQGLILVTDSNGDGTRDGDFGLASEIGNVAGPGTGREVDATLNLGVAPPPPPAAPTSRRRRRGPPPPPPPLPANGKPSAIMAGGDISVREVLGQGALMADQDVTIQGTGEISTDPLAGIALFAGRDVIIDANLLKITTALPPATAIDTAFKGLVYAERNVRLLDPTYSNPRNITIEGALVARSGFIDIPKANSVKLVYDPSFLKTMLKDRPNYRIRLERQSFNLF